MKVELEDIKQFVRGLERINNKINTLHPHYFSDNRYAKGFIDALTNLDWQLHCLESEGDITPDSIDRYLSKQEDNLIK